MKITMNLFFKNVAIISLIISTVACSKSNPNQSSAAPAATPTATSPVAATSTNSIDGYKSFKFGMKPSELAKLEECAPNDYDANIDAKIAKLEISLTTDSHSSDIGKEIDETNEKIAKLKKKKADGNLDPDDLHCEVNFGGNMIRSDTLLAKMFPGLIPGFSFRVNDQNRLNTVIIYLGEFNQGKLDALIKELQGKYSLSSSPSDLAIAGANREVGKQASWFFANNDVQLLITNYGEKKTMSLLYHDVISAKEYFKESQKGAVSSSDL